MNKFTRDKRRKVYTADGVKWVKPKKKQCRKLTPEEKKAVWAKDNETNAGAGWNATGSGEPVNRFPPNRERDTTPTVDKEFK